jgi:Fe-S oxidoreductase
MCNNNGECRKLTGAVMCPSFRVTGNEADVTRGRANSLRLAISGQLGPDALAADEMLETMKLCVSCKACKRECPTGVDMASMKVEFLHHYHKRHARTLHDKLVAHLPRYARRAAALALLLNLRDRVPGLAALSERVAGFSARRSLPRWRRDWFRGQSEVPATQSTAATLPRDVVLLADTFNTYFEPENLRAAVRVLAAAGYRVTVASDGERALCCGRTYLATGMVDEARAEATRTLAALTPHVARGTPVVGLEPSCVLGLRDEFRTLLPGAESAALAAAALTFEEFVVREHAAGRLKLDLRRPRYARALVHGHCHQKAFGVMPSVVATLKLVPGLAVETIASSCCGMAGAFGYQAQHLDVSMQMAELALLPAVTVIVADGTSCRHQIHDGAAREAVHVARVLAECLPPSS